MHSASDAISNAMAALMLAYAATSVNVSASPLSMSFAKNSTKLKTNVFNTMARMTATISQEP